jgi:virginiamycin B lyase
MTNQIGRITAVGEFTEYAIPTPMSKPWLITAGPDGALWFTEANANQIGRVTVAGAFTEFPIPTAASQPMGITAGPDGALWFTEVSSNQIGSVTTAGAFHEYPAATVFGPDGITAGPDGALWFTATDDQPQDKPSMPVPNMIRRITTAGVLTAFPLPLGGSQGPRPWGIATGSDGNVWFTEAGDPGKIGRIAP